MGIRNFDAGKVLEAVVKMQTEPGRPVDGGFAGNRDLGAYLEHKYVPADRGRASNTLEYSFDDWAVGQLALSMGEESIAETFLARSGYWRNMFDLETGFARMRNADGSWVTPFDPIRTGGNEEYVEGNAWQLTYFVPQDMPGLIEVMGRDRFLERLEDGFSRSVRTRFNAPNELYWDYPVVHGNQQSMHFAFLFNWAGTPWLTQHWSREVLQRYYGHGTGDAYLGDEDQGQMSAWFVMASMGLFQMDGGCRVDPVYELGSPLYPRVTIDLGARFGRGRSFTITARNASRSNRYIQSARLNGEVLNRWWFRASELLRGGELVLEMGPEPNRSWGEGSPSP
jgi:predicted alpha-1,2-mannosidase